MTDLAERMLQQAAQRYEAGNEPLYWCGYMRGVRRGSLGRRFSSNTDHFAWLDFAGDTDQCVQELGRGYRDGLQAIVMGRATVA